MTDIEKKIFDQLLGETITIKIMRDVLVTVLIRLEADLNRSIAFPKEIRGVDQDMSIRETRGLIDAIEKALTPNSHET